MKRFLIVLCLWGVSHFLYANSPVIEVFSAGPDKPKTHTQRVQTRFASPNPKCNPNFGGFSCWRTFLQIDQNPKEPRDIANYNKANSMGKDIEGSSQVPDLVRQNSIQLLKVPLSECKKNNTCYDCK